MSRVAFARLQALLAAGDYVAALESAGKLLRDARLSPGERVEVLRMRSIAHERLGNLAASLDDVEKARILMPYDARLCNEAGLLLSDLGRRDEAITAFRRAVALDPRHARALCNLGTALKETGQLADAVHAYESAIAAKPDYALAWANLGSARRQLGLRDEALVAMDRALALDPNNKPALLSLAALRRAEAATDAAVDLFTAALRVDPRDAAAWLQLGGTLAERDDIDPAREAYARAEALDPALLRALLGRRLTMPMVSRGLEALGETRKTFAQGLDSLGSELPLRTANLSSERVLDELRWVNWLLAYHGEDARSLQQQYGGIVAHAVQSRAPQWREPLARRDRRGRRLRVGFLSGFFRDGTVGRYFQHWITDLDRSVFDVVVYHTTPGFDHLVQRLASRADTFRRCPLWAPSQLAPLVRDDELDVLVYPELGLEPTTFALAALRLAPLQCAAWGHPVTTGHATIDAFFSSGAMEPPDAQTHYTERLVLLPGIGTRYARAAMPSDASRARFGLPEDAPLFLCPQTHYKIHPDNDALFAGVLAANPTARLVLFEGRHARLTATYLERLTRTLTARGVDRSRLVMLPTVGHDDYMRINAVCDVMLDTLHWSGGNTSLDALAAGLPIVTLPGRFMRGRQTFGMLRLMGLDDLVARDQDHYIAIASRAAAEPAWRQTLSSRILASSARIFDDPRPIAAVGEFLLENG